MHLPPGYDAHTPAMLVLNFHGVTMTAEEQEHLSGMNAESDAHGFLLVYPRGIDSSWNAGPSCCGTAQETGVDDVQFVRDLLSELATRFAVDPKRVYATGMSNGAFLSHRLGCELADRFAAIAPVAGVMNIEASACTPTRSVPVLDFHGTDDWVVPYDGTLFGSAVFTSVPATIAKWRMLDGCGPESAPTVHGDTTCVTSSCKARGEVTLCTVTDGGHAWPGSASDDPSNVGYATRDVRASAMIYDFFAAHPMP